MDVTRAAAAQQLVAVGQDQDLVDIRQIGTPQDQHSRPMLIENLGPRLRERCFCRNFVDASAWEWLFTALSLGWLRLGLLQPVLVLRVAR